VIALKNPRFVFIIIFRVKVTAILSKGCIGEPTVTHYIILGMVFVPALTSILTHDALQQVTSVVHSGCCCRHSHNLRPRYRCQWFQLFPTLLYSTLLSGQIAIQLFRRSIRQALRNYSGLNAIRIMIFTLLGVITLL
jgi:hypothetical protein